MERTATEKLKVSVEKAISSFHPVRERCYFPEKDFHQFAAVVLRSLVSWLLEK